LGISRLNFMLYILQPLAKASGLSIDIFVKLILSAAVVLLVGVSSVWYCTSTFPIHNFRKFMKFFLIFVVGGGMIGLSFYTSATTSITTATVTTGSKLEIFLVGFFGTDGILVENHFLFGNIWVVKAMLVFILSVCSIRLQLLISLYRDICTIYTDTFGINRVRPVDTHCVQYTKTEAEKRCQEFTRMELEKLKNVIYAMPRQELMEKVSATTPATPATF
jgi:hypothetical protein